MDILGDTSAAVGNVGRDLSVHHHYYNGRVPPQSECDRSSFQDPETDVSCEQYIVVSLLASLKDTKINRAKLKAIEKQLQKLTGDASITIVDVEEGSIKITLKGSEEGLQRLQELFDSGELSEIESISVGEVRSLTKEEKRKIEDEVREKIDDVLSLVNEIEQGLAWRIDPHMRAHLRKMRKQEL